MPVHDSVLLRDRDRISRRELDVLACAADGLSAGATAQRLFIQEQTVKFHRSNIFRKLGVNNSTGAVLEAIRRGLLPCPCPNAHRERDSV